MPGNSRKCEWAEVWREEMGNRVLSICRQVNGHYSSYINRKDESKAWDYDSNYPAYSTACYRMEWLKKILNSGIYSGIDDVTLCKELLGQ